MKKYVILPIVMLMGVLSSVALSDDVSPDKLLHQYEMQTKEVVSKLSDPNTWKDAISTYKSHEYKFGMIDEVQTKELLKYLTLARTFRNENGNLMDILANQNAYSPYNLYESEQISNTYEKSYPVVYTLFRLGLKSAKALVKIIKVPIRNQYESMMDKELPTANAILILAVIYHQGGGQAKEMTKQRLFLEITSAKGNEKEFLEKAITATTTGKYSSPGVIYGLNVEGAIGKWELITPYRKDAEIIISKLSDPALWQDAYYKKDKAKTETLLTYLKLAYVLRCDGIEKVLVNHLIYSPFEGQDVKKDIALETVYPVYNTLCQIGITSVIPLIDLLKSPDTVDTTRDLIIQGLVNIYEQGGFGKEMTKYRLQLDVGSTIGKEKELLEKALQNPLLK